MILRFWKILLPLGVLVSAVSGARAQVPRCAQVFETSLASPILFQSFDLTESWGRQLFRRDLDVIERFFKKASDLKPSEKIDLLLEEDIRRIFYRLQGLAKVYRKSDAEFFDSWFAHFKAIEDRIGRVAIHRILLKKAINLNEKDLASEFEKDVKKSEHRLLSLLQESGWLNDAGRVRGDFKKRMKAYDFWMTGREERRFLEEEVIRSAKKLRSRVKALEYDRKDIEKGLHELRREVRWVIIQVLSMDGVVRLQHEDLSRPLQAWLQEMTILNPHLHDNKYIRFSAPQVDGPMLIPQQSFTMMADIVLQVGNLKDHAELQIHFEETLKKMGLPKKKRRKIMEELNQSLGESSQNVDHRALSRQYQNRLNETDLLGEFIRHFEILNQN